MSTFKVQKVEFDVPVKGDLVKPFSGWVCIGYDSFIQEWYSGADPDSPEDAYKKNFGLWKIWQRDLIESMSTSDNKKRLSYLVGQVTTSLGEMKNLVQEQSRGPLQQAISTLTEFKEDITAPVPRRSLGSWKTDLEMMEKNIRKDFNLSIIKENLREAGP